MTTTTDHPEHSPTGETRRDFITLVAGAMGTVAAAVTVWPFLDSLNPAADTVAAGAPIDIDISHVEPGQQITVLWRSRPVHILNRTPAMLKLLQEPKDLNLLSDPNSEVEQQPPYATNWHRSIKPEFFVFVGICTHLGCIPEFQPKPDSVQPGWIGGYFCPCHGSKYDLAARVYSGVPAPYNMPVPPYNFIAPTIVRIGENPPNIAWDFSSIVQI
ncbi:MAG TPA: ubiquinol-cytochrome c reductase iron-sulfur subunit [Stellaceae bacterium]|nr:ubiquinol-cytochrome c reductase iron-sulfur subunit [Stellaceae bacterium]